MRSWCPLVFLVACSTPPATETRPATPGSAATTPSGSGAGSGSAADVVDRGVFVWKLGDQPGTREEFTVRRAGSHLVMTSKSIAVDDQDADHTEGELETDAAYRPVRAAFRRVTRADSFEIRLGGTPLTLDITRADDRDPQHVVAAAPIDVFLEGPGTIAMTALCKVAEAVTWRSIGARDSSWSDFVVADQAPAVGSLHRVVADMMGFDLEVVCDGTTLVAGGAAPLDAWFVREGRDADLAALKAAPRPPKRVWAYPVDATEPWEPLHTYRIDDVLVTRDVRRRVNRLTAFDLKTGAELTHRDIAGPSKSHVMCNLMKGRLACENSAAGYLQVLDARTLEPTDLAPLVAAALPDVEDPAWSILQVAGDRIDLQVDEDHAIQIDVGKRTTRPIPTPKTRSYGGDDPTICASTLGNPLPVGKEAWTIAQDATTATLVRTRGKAEVGRAPLPFDHPQLLTCKVPGGGAYVVTFDETASVLAALAPDTSVRWKTELGAHPAGFRVLGKTLLVTADDENRRAVSIDAATGKILWVAVGPQAPKAP